MLLRFFRSCLIISLLTSNEAKIKTKFQDTPQENQEMNYRLESKSLQNLASSKNKYRGIHLLKYRYGKTTSVKTILFNRKLLSSTQVLAEELAKEALKSPKMHEELKRLKTVKTDKRNSRDMKENLKKKASVIRSIKATKGYYKPSLLKDPKRKKRKKHKCGFGLGWCSDSNLFKHDSFKKAPTKIHQRKTTCKRERGNPTLQVIHSSDDSRIRKVRKAIVRENMLQRVMKTTTKDPKKKSPGDPGMEYSEYYNDDEINDPPVAKLQREDDDSKIRSERQITGDKLYNIKNRGPHYGSSVNKLQINQGESRIQEQKTNPLEESYAFLNKDEELNDDSVEDQEDALNGNESDMLFSQSDKNKNQIYQSNQVHENQDQQQNQIQQKNQIDQNQVDQQNQIYRQNHIYQQNPYLISDPKKYGRLSQQQIGLTPNPQCFNTNQYQNPNQIFFPNNIPSHQIPIKDINSNYKGSYYKRNQPLVAIKEPQQLYPGIESISLNSTISESTSLSSTNFSSMNLSSTNISSTTVYTSTTASVSTVCSSMKKLCSTNAHSIIPNDNVTPSIPVLKSEKKYNFQPKNSFVPLINQGYVLERKNQQKLNSSLSTSDTQVIANQILSKIVDELEDLKVNRAKKSHKEGRLCKLSGSWETSQAGVKLNMKVVKHTIKVTTEKLSAPQNHEGILNPTWNLSGQVPFRHGGPFSLIAINHKSKSLALFVGSCRVCQEVDTIEGIWTVSREPHGCQDFQMATGIYNDIFRRMRQHNTKRKKDKKSNATESLTISNFTSNSTKSKTKTPKS